MSIGNTENKQINIEGKQIPIKIISYYDKLTDFGFDNKNMQMKFDMPFNWNQSRLNKSSIFVHEEISTKTKCLYYEGLLHWKGKWMDISKNTVIQLADQVNKNGQVSTGLMKFDFTQDDNILPQNLIKSTLSRLLYRCRL